MLQLLGMQVHSCLYDQFKKRYLCTLIEIKANLKKNLNAGERFHDVAVEVANSSSYIQRGFYKGPAMTQEVVEILCDDPTNARYVRLRIIHGTGNVLNIAELEIYTK